MKKIIVGSIISAMVLLTGCSQKSPEVDMTAKSQNGTGTSSQPSGEVVADDKLSVVSEDGSMGSKNPVEELIKTTEAKSQTIYFDFDKFDIKEDMVSKIDANANLFNGEAEKALTIKVEGNCDEWGTDEYNFALGLKRAKSVKSALVNKGIAENRFVIISYGESNPVCTEKEKSCWDKNRRAEFKLLP
jgi:peptidoglycan-associated lipoprotein